MLKVEQYEKAWGMRRAERRKVNVFEMMCLRSFMGVSQINRDRNEEVSRRAGIRRELVIGVDKRVQRWEYRDTRRDWMSTIQLNG